MSLPTPGHRVRFISYLNPDCVLGTKEYDNDLRRAALRNLSTNNNTSTLWFIQESIGGAFKIQWAYNPSKYLHWMGSQESLWIGEDPSRYPQSSYSALFRVDPVKDGDWFALNNYARDRVVDVAASNTAADTDILCWRWNGGDNQVWRTEIVP